MEKIEIKLMRTKDCHGGDIAAERFQNVCKEFGNGLIDFKDIVLDIEDLEGAEREHIFGSPTFLINGLDPFWDGEEGEEQEITLGCRPYINYIEIEGKRKRKIEKSPTEEMLREAINNAFKEVKT